MISDWRLQFEFTHQQGSPSYGSEAWPPESDRRGVSVPEHRCLGSIDRIEPKNFMSSTEIRHGLLGGAVQSVFRRETESQYIIVVGACFAFTHSAPVLLYIFSEVDSGQRTGLGGRSMTLEKGPKSLISELVPVGVVTLPGWGPRNPRRR